MVGRVLVESVPAAPAGLAASPTPSGTTLPATGEPSATPPGQIVLAVPPLPTNPTSAPLTEAEPPGGLSVSGARLTSSFSPVHQGIDLAAPQGTPIYVVAAGVVVESYFDARSGWGWTVLLQHEGGLRTRYSHNSANVASVGEQVQAGQLIARVGSTGPHVDYRVYAAGVAIDPLAPPPGPSAVR